MGGPSPRGASSLVAMEPIASLHRHLVCPVDLPPISWARGHGSVHLAVTPVQARRPCPPLGVDRAHCWGACPMGGPARGGAPHPALRPCVADVPMPAGITHWALAALPVPVRPGPPGGPTQGRGRCRASHPRLTRAMHPDPVSRRRNWGEPGLLTRRSRTARTCAAATAVAAAMARPSRGHSAMRVTPCRGRGDSQRASGRRVPLRTCRVARGPGFFCTGWPRRRSTAHPRRYPECGGWRARSATWVSRSAFLCFR
jgi:hypothetical protein